MTLQASQSVAPPSSGALTTPTALTPAATDTIDRSSFGERGVMMILITTGTSTDVTVNDSGVTALGYAGTVPNLAGTASGTRLLFIPTAAVNPATGLATVNFSGTRTGVSYNLVKV